jgi:PPK2 family polyphosphate:nucleotide phosphotransferase
MKSITSIHKETQVTTDTFKLDKHPTSYKIKYTSKIKGKFKSQLRKTLKSISNLQTKLYAEDSQSLLIILQGMDTSGKDGTIKYLLKGINPQGVIVSSFKHPSTKELEHDFLWRHHIKLPEHGQIAIFNRSHYENVLISKVHPDLVIAERLHNHQHIDQINHEFWMQRYAQIKQFEKSCIESGTQVIKLFLNISKDEQRKRFIERIDNVDKHWKFSNADIEERKFWNKYQMVYEQAIKHSNTTEAPWFVIPADDKSLAHLLIGKIILRKLESMRPKFPAKTKKEMNFMKMAKINLLKEMA